MRTIRYSDLPDYFRNTLLLKGHHFITEGMFGYPLKRDVLTNFWHIRRFFRRPLRLETVHLNSGQTLVTTRGQSLVSTTSFSSPKQPAYFVYIGAYFQARQPILST